MKTLLQYLLAIKKSEIFISSVYTFILKILNVGLVFLFNLWLVRLLGKENSGVYFLGLSITLAVSVIGGFGLNGVILKYMGERIGLGDFPGAIGVHDQALKIATVTAGLLSLLLFFIAHVVSVYVFKKPTLTNVLQWMGLSILPFTLTNIYGQSFLCFNKIKVAMLLQGLFAGMFGLIFIYPAIKLLQLNGAAAVFFLGSLGTYFFAFVAWKNRVSNFHNHVAKFSAKKILAPAKSLVLINFLGDAVIPYAPIILLGVWASAQEVAIFGVAARISMLVSFFLVIANNVLAPKLSEIYSTNDWKAFEKFLNNSYLGIFFGLLPLVLIIVFFPSNLLNIFGSGFDSGILALVILTIGQAINVIVSPGGFSLTIFGENKFSLKITFLSVILLIGLSILLIPYYGSVGVAISTTSSVLLRASLTLIFIRKKLIYLKQHLRCKE